MALLPGSRVGAFEVVSALGRGGMGEVYRARDTELGRDVAIKVLSEAFEADQDRLSRFRREARALAALNHPAIGAIYGFETSDSGRALILELVEGPTLAERLATGPLPILETIDAAAQIAEGLGAAHGRGLVHRDLKPANVKVAAGRVKILDFGLAKQTTGSEESGAADTVTQTGLGLVVGTVPYMSPEQALGREVDARSDLFSLGVMIFEMATGRRPWLGASATEIIDQILHAELPALRLPDGTQLHGLERVVRRCLAKDRERRYPDAAALGAELRGLSQDGGSAAPQELPPTVALPQSLAVGPTPPEPVTLPRRLWELDLVLGILIVPALIYLGWFARKLLSQPWAWGAFYTLVLSCLGGAAARGYVLVMAAFRVRRLAPEARRGAATTRVADGLAVLALAGLAAGLDPASYVVTLSLLLGAVAAVVLHALWITPLLQREAFPAER